MSDLLVIASWGAENPSRASLPFFVAKAAAEKGRKVGLVLAADASPLAVARIREEVTGVGFPPLRELYQSLLEHQVPIYL